MRTKLLLNLLAAIWAPWPLVVQGSWQSPTAGLPSLEFQPAQQLGSEQPYTWFAVQDPLGRLIVGTSGLSVYDGQAWNTHRVGPSVLRTLEFGRGGQLWVGALNEIGYFAEPAVGRFEYHSLLPHLPETERQVGHIWGSGLAGDMVYFIGREKVYGWDGNHLRTWVFPGESRLFPLKFDGESWFHHPETGLYRLTPTGPHLATPAPELGRFGILGVARDDQGLLYLGAQGFFRSGPAPFSVFDEKLNRSLAEGRPTALLRRNDGTLMVGTLNAGLFILGPDGELLRRIDDQDHAGLQGILGIAPAPDGAVWLCTSEGLALLEPTGSVTVHNARNGLGAGADDLDGGDDGLYVANRTAVYRLNPEPGRAARFVSEPMLQGAYYAVRALPDGLLVGRHGGADFYNGTQLTPVYNVGAKGIYQIEAIPNNPHAQLMSEGDALVWFERASASPGFTHRRLGTIPDFGGSLVPTPHGRAWVGTTTQGAYVVNLETGDTTAMTDPATGQPSRGPAVLGRLEDDVLIFLTDQVLRAQGGGPRVASLRQLPGVVPVAVATHDPDRAALLAFKRAGAPAASAGAHGLGRLIFRPDGTTDWQELDVPALRTVGLVQSLRFLSEAGKPVLWIGGTEGLLRLDYESIPRLIPPPSPQIRLEAPRVGLAADGQVDFPFKSHHVALRVFTGNAARASQWTLQTRLSQDEASWSAPASRRTYEFSNLSEGTYRFEVRTVDAAGQASPPAVFTFRILPPWYRSKVAYAGYILVLLGGLWFTIRWREARIVAQNLKLEKLVQQRTAELVKANAAKDEFLAGVSHEIRNPMNGVIGISESLQTAGLDAESRHKFSLLRQCAGHLSSLLEDLLDLSKMQAGVIETESASFDLPALVDTVVAMAASDSEKRGIPVETAISPGVPQQLVGDARRIRQILLNFINNALKFSGRGQVEVTVWCQPAGSGEKIDVIFAVADEGPGISAEEQARLFNRFERGAAARGGRVAGTGLGLALCKGYAEKMGGRIWLESEPGKGSCFYFSVPLTIATEPAGETADGADETVPAARPALVVDDQEYNRIVLVDLLARLGFRAVAAADGAEALARAAREEFALIFLDYDLPGISGLEVARGIRALPGGSARAAIFATTAFNTPEKQKQCLDAGMDAFLGKPVTLERLRKALASAGRGPATDSVPAAAPAAPTDGLANLRLLAGKKNVSFEDEAALYLSEMQVELDDLAASVRDRQPVEAARHAHRLCGRFSFIYERTLEQLMRRLEEAAAKQLWADADRLAAGLPAQVAELRLKLASSDPAAPPA